MIRFEHVYKRYDSLTVLEDLTFEIKKGELIVLIGPSGSGKTTTLKLINQLVEPTEGAIFVGEKSISEWDPIQLRRHIGYVIQEIGLFPYMTIAENIAYVLRITGRSKEAQLKKAESLIQLVDMDPSYLKRFPQQLSGGQQQRIGVARALAADPDIILMDEPFGALDQITRKSLQDELLHLQAKLNKTIVFVTHDIQEAIKLGTRIALFKDGKIIQLDTPRNLILHPANDFVSEFFSSNDFLQLLDHLTVDDVKCQRVPKRSQSTGMIENTDVDWNSRRIPMVDNHHRFAGTWDTDLDAEVDSLELRPQQTLREGLKAMMQTGAQWLPVVSGDRGFLGVICFTEIYQRMMQTEENSES